MAPSNTETILATIILAAVAAAAVAIAAAAIRDIAPRRRPQRVLEPGIISAVPDSIRPIRRERANRPRHIRRKIK